jgi:hypothetical protein
MKTLFYFLLVVASMGLVSCEEPIAIELDKGTAQLAVDGLVIVDDGPQKIRLTLTDSYFSGNSNAGGVSGATVKVQTSDGQTFSFAEDPANPGDYVFPDSIHADTGTYFLLSIQHQGETYQSASLLMRGTSIDTLNQEERPAEFGNEAGTYLNFRARDPKGFGDFFWIRYSLNGKRDLRPGKILVSADAAFNPGSADGLEFIYPVRNSVNNEKGYLKGDQIEVELLSIDVENYRFLFEMNTQINNTGLFAEPLANVRGNIINSRDPKGKQAVGCFGVARVARASLTIQ